MNHLKTITLILLFFFAHQTIVAQDKSQSISISLLKENSPTAIKSLLNPFQKPFYFGGAIGYEWKRKQINSYSFHHVLQLGYYHHKLHHQNIFLMWKPKFQLTIAQRLHLKLFPGIGYAHTFPTQETYELKDGEYQRKDNFGKPHAMLSIGGGLGFQFQNNMEFFIHSEFAATLPYAPEGTLPFNLSSIFTTGINFQLK